MNGHQSFRHHGRDHGHYPLRTATAAVTAAAAAAAVAAAATTAAAAAVSTATAAASTAIAAAAAVVMRAWAALTPALSLGACTLAPALLLGACTLTHPPSSARADAQLLSPTPATRDLLQLPPPKGKVAVAVYGFRDQTGQYKPSPDSSFSTAVTQGASSILVKALKESGWFIPVERENLQNLLTERKIVRALETPQPAGAPAVQIPPLLAASVLIEGGIVAYESNVRTGGAGARFLGVGLSTQYRIDQVTINVRSIDIRGGQVLQSISTTKTIYSYETHPSVFKFVNVKDLVELEGGMTRNEPAQLCVAQAIEAAVAHLIVQGVKDGNWALKDDATWNSPVVQRYLSARDTLYAAPPTVPVSAMPAADVL